MLDLNLVPYLVHGAIRRYRALLAATDGVSGDIAVKVRVDETWRRVPFIDLKGYVRFVADHGVPVIQDDSVFAPPEADAVVAIPRDRPATEEAELDDTIRVVREALAGLGVQLPVAEFARERNNLLRRAQEVQQRRVALR